MTIKLAVGTVINMKNLLAAILMTGLAAPAFSNVVYTWHTTSTSDTISAFSSQIEITDEAYYKGSAAIDWRGGCFPDDPACFLSSGDGIVAMNFDATTTIGPEFNSGVPTFRSFHLGWNPPYARGSAYIHLSFGDYLTGGIYFNDLTSQIGMSGSSVDELRSDNESCPWPMSCGGVTGYYLADAVPLPEPASLALVGFGLLALLFRRKASKAH